MRNDKEGSMDSPLNVYIFLKIFYYNETFLQLKVSV